MSRVYLVGAGPGDKELLTIKAAKAIESADIILYDRLVNPEILEHAREDAKCIFCGKQPGQHQKKQEEINQLMVDYAQQGNVVARLKGGDPFIFGRGGEEALLLEDANVSYQVIPGVTSASSAATYAGIPLTHRDLSGSVTFMNGSNPSTKSIDEWKRIIQSTDTLCFYMGIKQLYTTCDRLMEAGMDAFTPVAVIHWGTYDMQKTTVDTLINIQQQSERFTNPSMIIVGKVVQLHKDIQWFEKTADELTAKLQ
ncbi:uroporphyrin-III C-methyltransferase [Gracilibacillus halophilus YIM-C55.5]|uniref:Uroporphyrinogen-III C-methyltransferase n=1 Tax=Gracilibacillus halophilus YIM-C55.5 TaxID=1308866 RepID=N4W626_9BACI|nr:uroporphyrinogen-III C-methyltransferase [Gracilibacillus halophilus]ENH95658.1 uroporphyrin-III C-methyltransferase [Gracilibacillus halophilus YIM-C55.5]